MLCISMLSSKMRPAGRCDVGGTQGDGCYPQGSLRAMGFVRQGNSTRQGAPDPIRGQIRQADRPSRFRIGEPDCRRYGLPHRVKISTRAKNPTASTAAKTAPPSHRCNGEIRLSVSALRSATSPWVAIFASILAGALVEVGWSPHRLGRQNRRTKLSSPERRS